MPRSASIAVSQNAAVGLFFMQRYRFLTIDQYARVAYLHKSTASNQLRHMQHHGLLGSFGNTGIRGYGKTPKVYFLTRKGFDILHQECDFPEEILGTHKKVHIEARWSPQMYHRLRTVDLMISTEVAIRNRPHLSMVRTFLEYCRVKRGERVTNETADYVDKEETSENRLVPDAAFILENIETKKRALFFVEMDMATERIVSHVTRDNRVSLHYKISQYDRYLKSLRYRHTYGEYGEFTFFQLLFVTLGDQRIENIRREMGNLPADLAGYYRFTTYEKAMGDFLGAIWNSRLLSDTNVYSLVR
jgi:Replication-relaxation